MVDFAIIKENKPIATPNFHFIHRSFGSEVQKGSFLAVNNQQKLHVFVVDFLGKKVDLKIKSLI